jgi:hypothetical protein
MAWSNTNISSSMHFATNLRLTFAAAIIIIIIIIIRRKRSLQYRRFGANVFGYA